LTALARKSLTAPDPPAGGTFRSGNGVKSKKVRSFLRPFAGGFLCFLTALQAPLLSFSAACVFHDACSNWLL